jgi:hypothetical protein
VLLRVGAVLVLRDVLDVADAAEGEILEHADARANAAKGAADEARLVKPPASL